MSSTGTCPFDGLMGNEEEKTTSIADGNYARASSKLYNFTIKKVLPRTFGHYLKREPFSWTVSYGRIR